MLNWSSLFVNVPTGDYVIIPDLTFASPDGSPLDLTNLPSFSFSLGDFGSFSASGGTGGEIVLRSANFMDVYIDGTFTPGS